ncbi:hypothetical protein Bpfe_028068 [Biomphalaria pfeifferi]|uniref:Uncharacterized protein n=1 Tax=Biomphalaria pfeifferi TaxID=112525 RepID=A0AAD8AUA1_BIOPF|nr:hypothetical protein Bpfe_028068 [Biomphalaria pfeifferi]
MKSSLLRGFELRPLEPVPRTDTTPLLDLNELVPSTGIRTSAIRSSTTSDTTPLLDLNELVPSTGIQTSAIRSSTTSDTTPLLHKTSTNIPR